MSNNPSKPAAPSSSRWLTRGVLGIGLASLFSDWGHEAATSLLPAFLASLGAPAVALGIIEGVADGFSSFAKLAGGWLADRPHARKPIGILGYFATGISTFAYAFATTWPAILVLRALGWIGRGSRGPSRDALLADAVTPEKIGSAFGFERAVFHRVAFAAVAWVLQHADTGGAGHFHRAVAGSVIDNHDFGEFPGTPAQIFQHSGDCCRQPFLFVVRRNDNGNGSSQAKTYNNWFSPTVGRRRFQR